MLPESKMRFSRPLGVGGSGGFMERSCNKSLVARDSEMDQGGCSCSR